MSSMVVNTNITSLSAQYALQTKSKGLSQSLERLSSGLRINSAKDDAAGLVIANRMTTAIKGSQQSWRNVNDGISMAQTSEGSLSTISSDLQRMRELAVQSANDSNTVLDRITLDNEFQQLIRAIGQVADTTQFNQQHLLNGSRTEQVFQIGAQQGERLITGKLDVRNTQLGAREIIGADGVTHRQMEQGIEQISGRFTIHIDRVGGQDISPMQLHIDLSDPRINPDVDPVTGNTGLRTLDDLNRVINRAVYNTIQGTHPPGSFEFDAVQMSAEEARHKLARVNLSAASVTKNDDKNTVALSGAFDARFRLTMDDPLEVVVNGSREVGISTGGVQKIGEGEGFIPHINAMFIVDHSGSMYWPGSDGLSSMDRTKEAIVNTLSAYQSMAITVSTRIIGMGSLMSTTGFESTSGWINANDVINNINHFLPVPGAYGQNYYSGIQSAMTNFNVGINDGFNVSFLMADGWHLGQNINTFLNDWTNFLVSNQVISYGIGFKDGFGGGLTPTNRSIIDHISYDGIKNENVNGYISEQLSELPNLMLETAKKSTESIEISIPFGISGLTSTFNDGIGQRISSFDITLQGKHINLDVSDITDLNGLASAIENRIRAEDPAFANISIELNSTHDGFTITNPNNLDITRLRLTGPDSISLFERSSDEPGIYNSEQVNLTQIDITTRESAMLALHVIDGALQQIADHRAVLGTIQNEFANTLENLSVYHVNLSAARSRILDTDFAEETAALTRAQILKQAGISTLSQANTGPQAILALLQ